jgi:shikimate kinase
MKVRIDKLLVERGLVASRERAQAMVLSGRVLVNEQKVEKAGAGVAADAEIRLLGEDLKYVGRGGLKLEAALESWKIDLTGRSCMDIGASTGGFTDCMLQHGAAEVIAVDTGYGQIHARLRSDPRVKLLEKTNARVIALGGGAWTLDANRALIVGHNCLTVWLDAPFELCWERIISSANTIRPMAPDRERAQRLFQVRREGYELAQIRLMMSQTMTPDETAAKLATSLPPI